MIEIKKTGFLSNDYVAVRKRKNLAEFSRSFWSQKAEMAFDKRIFQLNQKGALKSVYTLIERDKTLLEILQPSALKTRLTFRMNNKDFEIVNKAWHSQSLLIKSNENEVGSVAGRGFLKTGAIVLLPDEFPVPVQVFIGWIAMVRWDDDANAAAAAG